MGRLIAIILGGAALAFYLPVLLPQPLQAVDDLWKQLLPGEWFLNLRTAGGGIFAGLALVLLAVRGRE
jgi:hypothetical protein